MNDKVYIVYQHKNKINGKSYIGITCQKPEYRWGADGNRYIKCPLFWNAIQKYGWDCFDHIILYTDLSEEEAYEMEQKIIAELHTTDPNYGYNLSIGGSGGDSVIMKNKWCDPEFKKDMSRRMRDAWKDPVKRNARSDATKARWANPEFKDFAMERVRNACKKAVRCIETGEVFDMMATAADKYKIHRGDLTNACKYGRRCGGYHWEYA